MHANQWQKGILIGVLLLVSFWLLSLIWGLAGKAQIAISQAKEVEKQYQSFEDRRIGTRAGCRYPHGVRGCAARRRGYRGSTTNDTCLDLDSVVVEAVVAMVLVAGMV